MQKRIDDIFCQTLLILAHGQATVESRDASIRYSESVSAPIRSFPADRVSVRRDRSKSDVVRILFCVVVKPHESHKNIIKHHKVFVH